MAQGKKTIIVVAGGTGGHLFPAEALAFELEQRGFDVHLFTDERAQRFVSHFAQDHIHIIPSSTLKSKNPINILRVLWQIGCGMRCSRRLFKKMHPLLVVGFGGYPTLPPLIQAIRQKIPTLIHEQNAVMGRANRLLSGFVTAIAGGFLKIQGRYRDKMTLTGNPLRAAIIKAASTSYQPPRDEENFNLLIFGGSQGASFFSSILPQALKLMPGELRARLNITQQARAADVDQLQQAYTKLAIKAEIAPFFNPMAEEIAKAHLIISRSGASTVSEITAIGRPALLVPYPGALDHDQAENAGLLADNGGAYLIQERDLSAQNLQIFLTEMMENPQKLVMMATAAQKSGNLQAAQNLADLAETLIEQLSRKVGTGFRD